MNPSALPLEVLDNICFFYSTANDLADLPYPLTDVLLISRPIYRSLSASTALYARIFKHKFSFTSIARRAFTPKSSEYAWQLKWYCQVLTYVRRRAALLPDDELAFGEPNPDEPSISELLFALWLMCLDDDGCNRLQMESAGAYAWVDAYVRNRLYAQARGGWPLDDARNSCALWVLWYLTTKDRLFNESEASREQLINLVLPFVTLPYRYPSAFAPPNHYHLPLRPETHFSDGTTPSTHTLSIPTPHGPYPIYISPDRVWLHVHFERRTPTAVPLVTDSAKLLYFSRREIIPFGIPPHMALTRAEHRSRVRARLEGEAQEAGQSLSPAELDRLVSLEISPTQQDMHELNAGLLGGQVAPHSAFGKGGGTALTDDAPKVLDPSGRVLQVDESGCLSQRWDNDWWRLRQCRSCWSDDDGEEAEEPSSMMAGFPRKGRVYTPGSLTGLWVGRMLIPSEQHLQALLIPTIEADQVDGEAVPRPANFSETSLGLMTVPVFMRLSEHVSYAPNPVIPCGGNDSNAAGQHDFDQGLSTAYFPDDMEYKPTHDGQGVVFSIPPSPQCSQTEEYVYQTLKPGGGGVVATKQPQPGRFHDQDTCPGCLARETALWQAKRESSSTVVDDLSRITTSDRASSQETVTLSSSLEDHEEVPPHDPHNILECDGIQDLVVTGETDDRHGQSWNHYTFHGRVRHHDGMVGFLRCPRNPRLGKIFFYGSIVGGQNFIGNWRVPNVDVGMPAWEGAFSLGKKVEED